MECALLTLLQIPLFDSYWSHSNDFIYLSTWQFSFLHSVDWSISICNHSECTLPTSVNGISMVDECDINYNKNNRNTKRKRRRTMPSAKCQRSYVVACVNKLFLTLMVSWVIHHSGFGLCFFLSFLYSQNPKHTRMRWKKRWIEFEACLKPRMQTLRLNWSTYHRREYVHRRMPANHLNKE